MASLCRDILDNGTLPAGDRDLRRLREAFDITPGKSIGATIVSWHDLCRHGDFDISNHNDFVKLGIVTWTVTLLLKQLGMLTGPVQTTGLHEWQSHLRACLEKYVVIGDQPDRSFSA